MESTIDRFSFKRLVAVLPRGEPLDVAFLKEHGLSAFHASHLAERGWLTHLGRGVYMLPGDTLTRDGSLAYLMRRHHGLHVGGKSALMWRGIRHHVTFRETVCLWGEQQLRLPQWLVSRFPCSYQTTRLFDTALGSGFGLQPMPGGRPELLVSTPERAMLELLSDVGKTESLQHARELVETLRSLRSAVIEQLLAHTTRVKVIRLARDLSAEFELPWADLANNFSKKKGGSRWVAVSRTGERLDLKP